MKKLINIFHSLPAWLSLRSAPAKPQAVSGAIRRDGAKPRSGTLSLFIIQNLFLMLTVFALVVKTIGIKDRITAVSTTAITKYLEQMSPEDKKNIIFFLLELVKY